MTPRVIILPMMFLQLFLWNGLAVEFHAGPWNGVRYGGIPQLTKKNYLYI